MFKSIPKYYWLSFVPYTGLGVLTVVLLAAGIIPLYYLWWTLVGWILIAGGGIAVGYHRIFAHGNYPNLGIIRENILLLLGTLGGQGSSITWVALHRGYHHRWSDTIRDPHSPIHGVYHAFIGWARYASEDKPLVQIKYAGPLLRRSNHLWFHRYHYHILWAIPGLIALVDWQLALCALCLPTAITLLQDNGVNVVGHRRCGIGYRNYDTGDNSHNNLIWGYLGWGQGWHNNHHYNPGSYDFGRGISGRWWEWDPCTIFKPLLK